MMNNSVPTSLEEWRQYWQAKGFPWRTEPEIDAKRQEELSKCRAKEGIYPFKGMKLSRADVEWLLATHENGRGPVIWSDEQQRRTRARVDLEGADLSGCGLSNLPLEGTHLSGAHLEGALLGGAHLEGALLIAAHLEGALLTGAHMEGAFLTMAHLEDAWLEGAHLERAFLDDVHLEGATLSRAHLEGATLSRVRLENTVLNGITLADKHHVGPQVADIRWEETILTVVDWSQVAILGDEHQAYQKDEYKTAVRANRQLAIALQDQGLNEDAARFAYRAQILQRKVFWMEREIGRWLFSLVLALLAGYGYRMWRILAAYLLVVLLCAGAYFVLGMYYEPHLSFLDAVLTSITAFHGRVFAEPFLRPGEPQLWVTAFEAVTGLVIEGVFIAMLTQKFFGK